MGENSRYNGERGWGQEALAGASVEPIEYFGRFLPFNVLTTADILVILVYHYCFALCYSVSVVMMKSAGEGPS